MTHAAEFTHWYDQSGAPRYTVIGKNGKERNTTLRDARKYGWVPSVTQIINMAARPGLEAWKSQQVLLAALTLPRLKDEPEAAYIQRIMADSREQAQKAAERGTAIHAAIQGHYEGEPPSEEMWPFVKGAADEMQKHFCDYSRWQPERPFSHSLGYGGKIDLASDEYEGLVLDFKTKEFGPDDNLKTWDEHHMQLAAYRYGLGMECASAAIVYVSVTVPGLVRVIEIPEPDLERGWECFKSLLAFWKAKNRFDSAIMKQAA